MLDKFTLYSKRASHNCASTNCHTTHHPHTSSSLSLMSDDFCHKSPKLPKTRIGSHICYAPFVLMLIFSTTKKKTNFLKRVFWITINLFVFDNDIENKLEDIFWYLVYTKNY